MKGITTTLALAACVSFGVMLCAQAPQNAGQATGSPHADHMEHRFDNAEESAKSFDDPGRDAWQLPTRVIEALRVKRGQIVADVGAGTGYFTIRLAKLPAAPKVYAVDIEPSMVSYVRQRASKEGLQNVIAVQTASEKTNLPEPVDLVLIVDTYHHLPNRVAYFAALRTLMKPAARVAIVDFRKGAPDGPPDEFRFTPDQITRELAQAGFVLETQHDFLPRQIFLVYRAK